MVSRTAVNATISAARRNWRSLPKLNVKRTTPTISTHSFITPPVSTDPVISIQHLGHLGHNTPATAPTPQSRDCTRRFLVRGLAAVSHGRSSSNLARLGEQVVRIGVHQTE